MAELGHVVVGVDLDREKIELLSQGIAPIYEPGLSDLLAKGIASGNLRFTTDIDEVRDSTVHFVGVGTPQRPDGAADLRAVDGAFAALTARVKPGDLVVGKSTVPVGTASRLAPALEAKGATLAWNPEFLREGFALRDTFSPDRIVYGIADGDEVSVAALDAVYADLEPRDGFEEIPRVVTDFATAELVKVSANSFLATKISFINAMAEIAEAAGADVVQLSNAIGYDTRIGHRFLRSGIGFGGGCLPKDIRGFMASASELGVGESLGFLREVDAINMRRRDRVVQMAVDAVGGDPIGRRIAVLGLAFKPDSDDVRDSPALHVASELARRGALVVATDPHANETARALNDDLRYVDDALEAIDGADVVLVLTEWAQFRELDATVAAQRVGSAIVIDGRNCLDPTAWRDAGWQYQALGRPAGAL